MRAKLLSFTMLSTLLAVLAARAQTPSPTPAQTPPPTPAQAPGAKSASKPAQAVVPSSPPVAGPVSKHYPILVIAHGNDPSWSLRLGMKGPERLDRANYPPVVLEPGFATRDESGVSWLYSAKDSATGAAVSVRLTREPCSDNVAETKFTFSVVVQHGQIGQLNGCGQSMPDKFPEFRKKNQLDPSDDPDSKDKDKDKKTVLDPITNFAPPVATAFLDASGKVILSRGTIKKAVAIAGDELALSHDGKFLLYTRSNSKTGPERSIMLYEFDSGHLREIASGNARQPFWSPDDSRIAYRKFDGKIWQAWTAPAAAPENATLFSTQEVDTFHGWVSATSVLASDPLNAYWLSEDRPPQSIPLADINGANFRSENIRVCPVNPDLLLISAYYLAAPQGAPLDTKGLNRTFFLYELRSKRRVVLGPTDTYATGAEWSRDGLQIFFTAGAPGKTPLATNRIFWDGSGMMRFSGGTALVVGK